jgi:hypothetical protein
VTTGRTTLAAALERYVQDLLDRAQSDGIRGALSSATVRRLCARELAELLTEHFGEAER